MTEGNPVAGPSCVFTIGELRKAGWTVIGPGERTANPLTDRLCQLLEEAQHEIERLRENRDFYQQDAATAWDKCEERRQEASRLRADMYKAKGGLVALIKAWEATKSEDQDEQETDHDKS